MSMILYVTLGTHDIDIASFFYDAALAPLGYGRTADPDLGWLGWGPDYDNGVSLWLCPPFNGKSPSVGNGTMVAFRARSAAEVRAFHAAAIANGGTDEGAPGHRLNYEPGFYAAYVRDPDATNWPAFFIAMIRRRIIWPRNTGPQRVRLAQKTTTARQRHRSGGRWRQRQIPERLLARRPA